ncbi:MAG: hypothetical protein PVS3B2_12680 [Candidatus Dormibacteraceae bacterium]
MHPADVELGTSIPVEAGTEVVVAGLKPRHARFHGLDVVLRETARRLEGRGLVASWELLEYGSWIEAVGWLRERRPSRVILPWRQDADLEILAGQLRQNYFSSLELFQPEPAVLATRLSWQVTKFRSRPWIP